MSGGGRGSQWLARPFPVLALCHHVGKTPPVGSPLGTSAPRLEGTFFSGQGAQNPCPTSRTRAPSRCPQQALNGCWLAERPARPGPGRGLPAGCPCSVVGSSVFQDGPVGVHVGARSWGLPGKSGQAWDGEGP